MALAQFRKVERQQGGEGRFVVSEGVAPSAYLLPSEYLPTLYTDIEDDRFEVVITKGTIVSLVADGNGDSRVLPANGTNAAKEHTDGVGATPTTVSVSAYSTPIACAAYDLNRPFDKGTSQGAGLITHGYVEWPMVTGLNDDLAVGDLVRADDMGRPVKCTTAEAEAQPWIVVGKVWEIESFATNFDDGLLSYMELPSDPGALREVFELTKTGTYQGKLGIRANLNTENAVGAFRVNLTL